MEDFRVAWSVSVVTRVPDKIRPGVRDRRPTAMVTTDDVREIATDLPRTVERLVRDRVKFNVGRLVYAALSQDERTLGCGFPKEERDAMIAAWPHKFAMPGVGDQRYPWIHVDLSAIDKDELRELITNAWRMCAPRTVVRAYDAARLR
jgi:hypothetical protein